VILRRIAPSPHTCLHPLHADDVSEKNTRGALKSLAERSLSRGTVVIFDSLNNIKGYRYELWCIARQAATRYCMVHVDTPTEMCRTWNAARATPSYEPDVFEDLAGR
jgi:protein KTI12